MIPVFQKLSKKIGSDKVIWRYDPIMFTKKYTPEYHLKAFEQIAYALKGYTNKCVISFVDVYAKNKKNMNELGNYAIEETKLFDLAKKLSQMARSNGMLISSCAEKIDLSSCGIQHNCCIDKELIEQIIGCKINVSKDLNQRLECGCVESVEIGTYNTCRNGCKYCYANYSSESVEKHCKNYNKLSPLLCGKVEIDDKISNRKVKSMRQDQISFFDI